MATEESLFEFDRFRNKIENSDEEKHSKLKEIFRDGDNVVKNHIEELERWKNDLIETRKQYDKKIFDYCYELVCKNFVNCKFEKLDGNDWRIIYAPENSSFSCSFLYDIPNDGDLPAGHLNIKHTDSDDKVTRYYCMYKKDNSKYIDENDLANLYKLHVAFVDFETKKMEIKDVEDELNTIRTFDEILNLNK